MNLPGLRYHRMLLGMTQEELGAAAGMHRITVATLEEDHSPIVGAPPFLAGRGRGGR